MVQAQDSQSLVSEQNERILQLEQLVEKMGKRLQQLELELETMGREVVSSDELAESSDSLVSSEIVESGESQAMTGSPPPDYDT